MDCLQQKINNLETSSKAGAPKMLPPQSCCHTHFRADVSKTYIWWSCDPHLENNLRASKNWPVNLSEVTPLLQHWFLPSHWWTRNMQKKQKIISVNSANKSMHENMTSWTNRSSTHHINPVQGSKVGWHLTCLEVSVVSIKNLMLLPKTIWYLIVVTTFGSLMISPLNWRNTLRFTH